jgi:hypothetical protein
MPLSLDDYYRTGHLYLETKKGREEVFTLLGKELRISIKKNRWKRAVWVADDIYGFVKKTNLIYTNFDLPNLSRLREESDEIKKRALRFLGEKDNIDLFKEAIVRADKAYHKSKVFLLLIKFMPEIERLPLIHFTDLYLMIFNTLYFLDKTEGTEEERFDLGDMLVRASCRYDCREMCESFVRDNKLKDLLISDEYRYRFTSYKEYGRRLVEPLDSMVKEKKPAVRVLTPFVFTDMLFYSIDERFKGLLRKELTGAKERILLHLKERADGLFDGDDKEIIKGMVDLRIKARLDELAKSKPLRAVNYPAIQLPFQIQKQRIENLKD